MSLTSYQAAPPCNKRKANVRIAFQSVNGLFLKYPERACQTVGRSLFSALPVPLILPLNPPDRSSYRMDRLGKSVSDRKAARLADLCIDYIDHHEHHS